MATGPYGFDMFQRHVGPMIFSGAEEIVNDAQRVDPRTLGYVLRGQPMSKTLLGSGSVQDTIFLDEVPTTETYRPGVDRFSYSDPQVGVDWTSNWRFMVTKLVTRDQEVVLKASSSMTQGARFQVYKDTIFAKKQNAFSSWSSFMEERYWAVPNAQLMEGTTSLQKEPYSIPVGVNMHANGLFPSYTPGGAWTTVQGINPTSAGNSRWAPRTYTYGATASSGFAAHNVENVISTLDLVMEDMSVRPPPVMKEYFEAESLSTGPRPVLFCSPSGKQYLKNLYRSENDKWDSWSDPWTNITYNGLSIVAIPLLRTQTLYANAAGNALVAETAANHTGPRFYLIDPKYFCSVFHKDKYFDAIEVARTPEDPEAKVTPYVTWTQNIFRSRRRHALIQPGNDY